MKINPYIFLLPKPPVLIIWNYNTHEQFEIDKPHANRLFELLELPSLFDENNPQDQTLFSAGVLLNEPYISDTWQWDALSKIFHIGTKNLASCELPLTSLEWARHYVAQCQEATDRPYPPPHRLASLQPEDLILLPQLQSFSALDRLGSLKQSLLNRKTCRSFDNTSVSLDDISNLLYLCLGYLSEREADVHTLAPAMFRARRSSPSGGGLNSSEGYLYAYNIRELDPGFYYYHPQKHALKFISRTKEPLGAYLQGQHFANNLPFGVFITSRLDKMWWKYRHSQAYRVSLLEVGHISQSLQLCATSLGLNTWLTAALSEQKIAKALCLPDLSEQVFLFFGAGHSDGQAVSKELEELLKKQQIERGIENVTTLNTGQTQSFKK